MLQPVRKRRGITICMVLAGVASVALPEPPKQHEPWTPPSGHGIPDYVVKVSTALFDAGLADPRLEGSAEVLVAVTVVAYIQAGLGLRAQFYHILRQCSALSRKRALWRGRRRRENAGGGNGLNGHLLTTPSYPYRPESVIFLARDIAVPAAP